MKHEYKDLVENIQVPEALNDRVLSAARQAQRKAGMKRRPILRRAVCALCALALVLGGVSIGRREDAPAIEEMEYTLGMTVYAAERGVNGGVFLSRLEGADVERLDGTTQALAVTYLDQREETGTYHLRIENLRIFINEDGSQVLVPVLAGDTQYEVTGLYAVPTDSTWLSWPVASSSTVSLSAPYGLREETDFFHAGIDIPGKQGMPITAAAAGTVLESGFDTVRGNYLLLDHGDGLTTLYGQCQEILARQGDAVEAGEEIALLGSTGMSTGPHLHFEVRQDGEAQNPVAYFNSAIRDTLSMG